MSKLIPKLWVKMAALLLLVIFVLMLAGSLVGIALMIDQNAYLDGGAQLREKALTSGAFWSYMHDAESYYTQILRQEKEGTSAALSTTGYENEFSRKNSNFFFTVTDTDGKVLFQTADAGEAYQASVASTYSITYNWNSTEEEKDFTSEEAYNSYVSALYTRDDCQVNDTGITDYFTDSGSVRAYIYYSTFDYVTVNVTGYVYSELTAVDDLYVMQYWLNLLIAMRKWLIAIAIVSLLCVLFLLVFLLCSAGHKEGVAGIHRNWLDRVPADLFLAAWALAIGLFFTVVFDFAETGYWSVYVVLFAAGCVYLTFFAMLLLMSFATRMKAGSWWRNTVIFYALKLLKRFVLWLCHGVQYVCRALPMIWRAVLVWGGLCLLELLIMSSGSWDVVMLWWAMGRLALTAVIVLGIIAMRKLQKAGERLAAGELSYSVDLRYMYWDLKKHGANLNSIAGGMQKAVAEQMKSERLKTELITNVSHDIKTPLTSIVNYVDLLKKQDVEPPDAKEYVAILDRQSARLKKLTEDLLEASKASSGAMAVSLEPSDLNVLLSQVAGEYEDRLGKSGLELVLTPCPQDAQILADGRLLWRVFDNLLNNICKYAMPGTRVYLGCEQAKGKLQVSFKNISKFALNITSDELMERFVRGDTSRNTEGSGLGLSIARSLTQLQHGSFELFIDGDLFKAVVSFDRLQ